MQGQIKTSVSQLEARKIFWLSCIRIVIKLLASFMEITSFGVQFSVYFIFAETFVETFVELFKWKTLVVESVLIIFVHSSIRTCNFVERLKTSMYYRINNTLLIQKFSETFKSLALYDTSKKTPRAELNSSNEPIKD